MVRREVDDEVSLWLELVKGASEESAKRVVACVWAWTALYRARTTREFVKAALDYARAIGQLEGKSARA